MTGSTTRAIQLVFAALLAVSAGGCRSAGPDGNGRPGQAAGGAGVPAAALIAGADVEYATTPQGEVLARPAGPHFRATATALTADGYYLTAAHCVSRRPVHLLVKSAGGFAFRPATVVWSSRAAGYAEDWADLALIHIEPAGAAPPAAFTWAPRRSIVPGSAAGATRVDIDGATSPRAGHVLDATGTRRGDVPLTCVIHDLQLEPGYSGGPLFDQDGKLIGINVRANDRVLLESGEWMSVGLAVRPDAAAIERLVREDRARRAARHTPATRLAEERHAPADRVRG